MFPNNSHAKNWKNRNPPIKCNIFTISRIQGTDRTQKQDTLSIFIPTKTCIPQTSLWLSLHSNMHHHRTFIPKVTITPSTKDKKIQNWTKLWIRYSSKFKNKEPTGKMKQEREMVKQIWHNEHNNSSSLQHLAQIFPTYWSNAVYLGFVRVILRNAFSEIHCNAGIRLLWCTSRGGHKCKSNSIWNLLF